MGANGSSAAKPIAPAQRSQEQGRVVQSVGITDRMRVSGVVALVAAAAFALWHWSDGPEPAAADYAQYLAHAQALSEGRPYTDTGYIFTPLYPWAGPAAQPPGLPLVLAATFRTIGDSAVAVKAVMLACALGFYALAGLYFARLADPRLGVAVVLLLGLSASLVRSATNVQSDLLFACLIWSVITLYDRDGPFTIGRLAAITVLGAFSVATRTVGVALVPAVMLFTVLHWRQHGFKPVVPVVIWGVGFLVTNMVLPITAGFPDVSAILRALVPTALDHVVNYRYALIHATLHPFPWDRVNDVYHLLAILIMIGGLATWLPEAFRRFSVVFAVIYVTMLMVLPVLAARYMWPVYPILAFGLVRGVGQLAALLRVADSARAGARLALATAVVIGVLNVVWTERLAAREPTLTDREDVQALFQALTRIAAQEPIRVAFVRPQVLALETSIPSMTTFGASPQVVAEELDRRCITHVVLGDLGLPPGDAAFRELVRLQPDAFRLEYRNPSFEVHRFTALACRRDHGNAWRHQT